MSGHGCFGKSCRFRSFLDLSHDHTIKIYKKCHPGQIPKVITYLAVTAIYHDMGCNDIRVVEIKKFCILLTDHDRITIRDLFNTGIHKGSLPGSTLPGKQNSPAFDHL